jgi:NNP family nitrate/nitrite transporter-like MFS transporter
LSARANDGPKAVSAWSLDTMQTRFRDVGHLPTLFSAFLYFDMSFMVWVLLGPLGVQIGHSLHLKPAQLGFMVAIPVLSGALLRVLNGFLVDQFKPRRVGIAMQIVVILALASAWFFGIHSYHEVLGLALFLGVAGAAFAIALPLASRWYPSEHQGKALGIAGAGNSGTVLAALFAPSLAVAFGWTNVFGIAAAMLTVTLIVFTVLAKDSPTCPPPRPFSHYIRMLGIGDTWCLMGFYAVTFGGFVGLASYLSIYFHTQYHLSPVHAGYATAAVVFLGSLVRPIGGAIADRIGGVRTLSVVYLVAATAFVVVSIGLPSVFLALPVFAIGMLSLGLGNGAVFQLVPQRFGAEIGIMTGLVGMAGGVGGFYLASSLGLCKQLTGTYQVGFLIFAGIALIAFAGITQVSRRWRSSWSEAALARV